MNIYWRSLFQSIVQENLISLYYFQQYLSTSVNYHDWRLIEFCLETLCRVINFSQTIGGFEPISNIAT